MDIEFVPFLSFVLITTFTPGPNNISSASMGILYGYKRSLGYLAGIVTGFGVVMLMASWLSGLFLTWLPSFEPVLRVVGACYILWLALYTLRASYAFVEGEQALLGFANGFALQALNVKAIIYGLTIYATFLPGLAHQPAYQVGSAVFLALVAFCAVSMWSLFGAAIRKYMRNAVVQQVLNGVLSLLLVVTAIELSGLPEMLRSAF